MEISFDNNHIITYDEVKEMRQSGHFEKAYAACQYIKQNYTESGWFNNLPDWVDNQLGWCLYDFMKRDADPEHSEEFLNRLQELACLSLNPDNYVINAIIWPIKKFADLLISKSDLYFRHLSRLLDILIQIDFTKCDNYSVLLSTFLKAKTWPDLKKFIVWWDLENLSESDYKPYITPTGQKIMSVAERAYIGYAKILIAEISNGNYDENEVNRFIEILKDVMSNHQDMQYPPYFLAKILVSLGEKEEAKEILLPFVVKKKNDYWVWDFLSDVLDDDDIKISCCCKALTCKVKDAFLCKLHLKLCDLLLRKDLFDEAKTELQTAIDIYRENGWHLPARYIDYCDESWCQNANLLGNNINFYTEHIEDAEALIYLNKPHVVIVITNINHDKDIANFVTTERSSGFFSFKKMPKKFIPKLHGIYDCRMDISSDNYAEVYTCKVLNDVTVYKDILYKHITGELKLIPNGAGFVNDVYIPASKIKELNSGIMVECTAYPRFDKSKQRWGWAADCIEKL